MISNSTKRSTTKMFLLGIGIMIVLLVVVPIFTQLKFLNPIMKWETSGGGGPIMKWETSGQNCNKNEESILATTTTTTTTSDKEPLPPPVADAVSIVRSDSNIMTITTTSSGVPVDSKFLRICSAVLSAPLAQIWRRKLLPDLFSKLLPVEGDTVRTNETMRDWYTLALNETYSFQDWKKTILHPPDMEGMEQILTLLENKLKDPDNNPPIRVAVYGGSVVKGANGWNSHHFPNYERRKCAPHCSWVEMLQEASDQILGPGIVSIANFGRGAAKTPYSTNLMEMGVWPESYPPGVTADIIIWSHGVNDSTNINEREVLNSNLGNFHKAARQTRCDTGLPMIIYLNDIGGHGFGFEKSSSRVMKLGGELNEITSWFGVMGVQVGRLWTAYNFANSDPDHETDGEGLPLIDIPKGDENGFGQKHGGIMLHATIAYAFIFNLLSASADICEVEKESLPTSKQRRRQDPSREFPIPLPKAHMPPLNDQVSIATLIRQWRQSVVDYEERCGRNNNNSSVMVDQQLAAPISSGRSVCSYSWLISVDGKTKLRNSVRRGKGLQKVMDNILVDNDGWTSKKLHKEDKHAGWNANKTGATFTVAIPDVSPATRYLRIVTMESYSDAWVNSSVKLTISVNGTIGDDTTTTTTTTSSTSVTHFISGYNNRDHTSPIIPHKLDVPPLIGSANGNIMMRFDLVGGRTFKIVAMALCEL